MVADGGRTQTQAQTRLWAFALGLAGAILAVDQAVKAWILNVVRLQDLGRIELSGVFDLTFVRNYGVSFGLLQAGSAFERWLLVGLSVVISGVFLWWMRTAHRRLTAAALGCVVGGAVGNMIDRVRFGYVVDFLDFSGLYFPFVFNVADAAITIGAGLLMLDFALGENRPGGARR
jgi:signal peptidase II